MSSLSEIDEAHSALEQFYGRTKGELEINNGLTLGISNWTYGAGTDRDLHLPAPQGLPVVFMGFNPGGGDGAQKPGMTRSERTWRTRCSRLAKAHPNEIVFAELISIPTQRASDLPSDRIEELMGASVRLNSAIISFHKPKVIFQTGLDAATVAMVERLYGLRHEKSIARQTQTSQALGHVYRMANGTPWIIFRHFASYGFSSLDRETIQQCARDVNWHGTV